MELHVDFNKKQLEKDLKLAGGIVTGLIALTVAKNVLSTAKNIKQTQEIKKLKKEVAELEERVQQLEEDNNEEE